MVAANPTGTRHLVSPEFLDALERFPAVELSEELLPFARAALADNPAFPPPVLTAEQAAVERQELFAPGLNGAPDVRMLVNRPHTDGDERRPGYLYIHGGGYVLGSPEMMDVPSRAIAADLGCVVVGVAVFHGAGIGRFRRPGQGSRLRCTSSPADFTALPWPAPAPNLSARHHN